MSTNPEPAYEGTFRIDKKGPGATWRVSLNDQRLEGLLAADGVRVEFTNDDDLPAVVPVVTLKFAPGALDIDLDVDLVESILAAKREGGA